MNDQGLTPAPSGSLGLTPEDLEDMIQQFNETTSRLMGSQQRLQERVIELTKELEEKNQALQQKRRLEELGEMAAGVAHEIRNPLGGIQLYASLLEKDLQSSPEQLRLIQQITQGVKHLNTIVEDMLAFTRDITPVLTPTSLQVVIEDAMGFVTGSSDSTKVSFERCFSEDPVMVAGDRHLLQRAVLNILLNAVQAIGEEGRVQIRLEKEQAEAVLTISDSGPGIPEDIMDKIFNPFFTRKDKGTGLGLAIVHRILQGHRGSVTVANHSEDGGGAVFTLRLPLQEQEASE